MARERLAVLDVLREHGGDQLRAIVEQALAEPMDVEVTELCKAAHGARTSERINYRNGYRHRE